MDDVHVVHRDKKMVHTDEKTVKTRPVRDGKGLYRSQCLQTKTYFLKIRRKADRAGGASDRNKRNCAGAVVSEDRNLMLLNGPLRNYKTASQSIFCINNKLNFMGFTRFQVSINMIRR